MLVALGAGCGIEPGIEEHGTALTLSLANAGFEDGWSGWRRSGSTGLTTVAHSGDTAGKVRSGGGEISRRVVGLEPDTRYVLAAWVLGDVRIGARDFGRAPVSTSVQATKWMRVYSVFTTGPDADDTDVEIYAAWNGGGDGRVDDVGLWTRPSGEPTGAVDLTRREGVRASTSDDNVAANAVDDSLRTRWSGYGDGAWLRVDLGAVKRVRHVDVAVYHGDQRRNRFELQVSRDAAAWKTVWSGWSSGATTARERYELSDADARYVRYVGHGSTSSGWSSVTELVVHGDAGGGSDSGSSDSDPGSSSAPDADLAPVAGCSFPGQLLDLSRWKLQLPYGDPTEEIKQPALADYSESPYFRVNGDCTAVRFRAPTDGDTTSGSQYPRSELREMTADGRDKASWSTTSGTHRMRVVAAVTALPRGKRHISVAQIHGGDNDLIIVRVEGSKLLVKPNGSSGKVLDSDYRLGERFTIELVAGDGKIRVYHDGDTSPAFTHERRSSTAYFKAGAYVQSNCDTEADRGEECGEDNYGEVRIYDLVVRHSS